MNMSATQQAHTVIAKAIEFKTQLFSEVIEEFISLFKENEEFRFLLNNAVEEREMKQLVKDADIPWKVKLEYNTEGLPEFHCDVLIVIKPDHEYEQFNARICSIECVNGKAKLYSQWTNTYYDLDSYSTFAELKFN